MIDFNDISYACARAGLNYSEEVEDILLSDENTWEKSVVGTALYARIFGRGQEWDSININVSDRNPSEKDYQELRIQLLIRLLRYTCPFKELNND